MTYSTDKAEDEAIHPHGIEATKFKVTCSTCGRKDSWTRRKRQDAFEGFRACGWERAWGRTYCPKCGAPKTKPEKRS